MNFTNDCSDEEESVRMADSTSEGETEAADPGHVDSDDTSISIPGQFIWQ